MLLGERKYGAASDMWGEVSDHAAHPDHPAGAISPEVWPSVESLDLYNRVEIQRIKERLKHNVINTTRDTKTEFSK